MQDQVRLLGEMGVAATFLNSTLSAAEASARGAALLRGDYRLLYVAPERLLLPEFRDRSEEHTSELQSLMRISYAVFCLKKKKNDNTVCDQKYTRDYHQNKIRQEVRTSKT